MLIIAVCRPAFKRVMFVTVCRAEIAAQEFADVPDTVTVAARLVGGLTLRSASAGNPISLRTIAFRRCGGRAILASLPGCYFPRYRYRYPPHGRVFHKRSMAKYVVRYGVMRALGVMSARETATFCAARRLLCAPIAGWKQRRCCAKPPRKPCAHLKNPPQGQVLREMTPADSLRAVANSGTAARRARHLPAARRRIRPGDATGRSRAYLWRRTDCRVLSGR